MVDIPALYAMFTKPAVEQYVPSGMLPARFKYDDTTLFARERANKSGMYDTDFVREAVRAALNQGVTPLRALGTYMKEANFGTYNSRNGEDAWLNPGQSDRSNSKKVRARMKMQGFTQGESQPGYFPKLREELIFDTIRQMREADKEYGKDTDRSIRQYNYRAPSDVGKTRGFMSDLMRNEVSSKC